MQYILKLIFERNVSPCILPFSDSVSWSGISTTVTVEKLERVCEGEDNVCGLVFQSSSEFLRSFSIPMIMCQQNNTGKVQERWPPFENGLTKASGASKILAQIAHHGQIDKPYIEVSYSNISWATNINMIKVIKYDHQTIFIIGGVWNTEFDTFWFATVGIQTTEPNLTNAALAASWIYCCGPGVCFKLIFAALCLPSQFENRTFLRAEYSKILSFFAIWQKISMPYKLSGKTEVFHALLLIIFGYK